MRFIVSIILASISFITSYGGNAGEVAGRASITNLQHANSSNDLYYSISDDLAPAMIQSNQRNNSGNHYRYHPFVPFINAVSFKSNVASYYIGRHFVQPHLYCKRIGLKLLFPEHYFW